MDNLRALIHVCLDQVCASVPFFSLVPVLEWTGQDLEGWGFVVLVFPPGSIKVSVSVFPLRFRV